MLLIYSASLWAGEEVAVFVYLDKQVGESGMVCIRFDFELIYIITKGNKRAICISADS